MQDESNGRRVTIAARYCGPPGVGQGGIVCATLAEVCGDSLEVTLRRPAPLDVELELRGALDGGFELMDGDVVIASGRPQTLELAAPPVPSWADAEAAGAAARQIAHPFPHCFVCGPARRAGDGLHVLTGPVAGREGLVAAVWHPHANFHDGCGRVDRRFLWAALDCPGGLAALVGRASPIVLGRFTGRLDRTLHAGERARVVGWQIERSGRRHEVGTALFGESGDLCGIARSTWVELAEASVAAA